MDKTALMIAGPILSAIGLYIRHRKKNVNKWMQERRIDGRKKEQEHCPKCGGKMVRRTTHTGVRKGMTATVCSNYPECRSIKWG